VKLLLPLKYYDEAGRVKPPVAVYVCALFLCRSLIVVIAALSASDASRDLLALIYPQRTLLYVNVCFALSALASLVVMGFRYKIWTNKITWLFVLIRPLLLFAAIGELFFYLALAHYNSWAFSWPIALTILVTGFCVFYLAKDKHLTCMMQDWRRAL
jgi:hypothetical protein